MLRPFTPHEMGLAHLGFSKSEWVVAVAVV